MVRLKDPAPEPSLQAQAFCTMLTQWLVCVTDEAVNWKAFYPEEVSASENIIATWWALTDIIDDATQAWRLNKENVFSCAYVTFRTENSLRGSVTSAMGIYSKIKQDDEGLAGILPTMSADTLSSCTLHRGLSSRPVQMIAIGGTIGTGLFLCTGRSLAQGGPATMLICYSVIGFIVYITLLLLGEMATQYPVAGESLDAQSRLSESGCLVPNVCAKSSYCMSAE